LDALIGEDKAKRKITMLRRPISKMKEWNKRIEGG